jgi:hypothetical protein
MRAVGLLWSVAVLAAACRASDAGRRSGGPAGAAAVDSAVGVMTPDSLVFDLQVPVEVRARTPVRATLRVENRASRSFDLYLRGTMLTVDVEVRDVAGEVVWRRLEGEIIPAIVHLRTLASGERIAAEVVWDQRTKGGRRVPPGAYTARGFLLREGEPLATPPRSFRIVGR